ncbi:kelch repeat protein [Anaeramoeba ignava]|uniref:Kelch repeat protein n=1 Tax=Anaeramoeba ignava TaxID=1746090 RepID=A0A9Q0R541_ANAIG|nr:kelch repeat protein [Anaeramoeba ignava]
MEPNLSLFLSATGWREMKFDPNSFKPPVLYKAGVVCLENDLYIFGGKPKKQALRTHNIYHFSFITSKWEILATKGDHPPHRSSHSMCGFDSKFWIFGGNAQKFFSDFYEFDLLINKWRKITTKKKPEGRFSHSMQYHKGKIYLFGGCVNSKSRLNDTWKFDTSIEKWEEIETFGTKPIGRSSHTSIIHDNKMLIFGGLGDNRKRQNDLFSLDLMNYTWNEIITQPTIEIIKSQSILTKFGDVYFYNKHSPFEMSGAVPMIYNDRYFIIFGGTSTLMRHHNHTFILDLETNQWINFDKLIYDHMILQDLQRINKSKIIEKEKEDQKEDQKNLDSIKQIEKNIQQIFLDKPKPPKRFGHLGFAKNNNEIFIFGGSPVSIKDFSFWIFTLEPHLILDLRIFLKKEILEDF